MTAPTGPGVWRVASPSREYVKVANDFARSKLKPGTKALALYLLSQNEGYVITQARIKADIGMSETAVARAIAELEAGHYLLRRVLYGPRAGVLGTAYLVSDRPMTTEEMAILSLTIEKMANETRGLKKTNSLQKTKELKKTPPGGDSVAPGKPPEDLSAQDVVRAYVDSFRLKAGGQDPTKRFIAQVGREAKKLLEEGRSPAALIAAATELGRTPYASLENQVMRALTGTKAAGQGATGTTYRPDAWDAVRVAERDADGLTAEDRAVMDKYGATISYG